MIQKKPLIWFLALAFGLAWILFLLPLAFRTASPATQQGVALAAWSAAMWAPGLAALFATRFIAGESIRTLGIARLGDKKTYLWAWLLPLFLTVVTGVLTWLFGLGTLDLEFTAIQEALEQSGAGAVNPMVFVMSQMAMGIFIGPLINTLFAVGEELGWRAFLLPRLLPLGQGRAIVLSGVIWGIWHAPAIAQGHNYPGHPVLGPFLMIGFTVLSGAILSWLYLRTRSVWAPALAHGAMNAIAALPLLFLAGVDMTLGGTLASLVGWIPMALFVGWLVWTKRLPVKESAEDAVTAEPVVQVYHVGTD